MVVGRLECRLAIPAAGSLKDKRRVIRSLIQRLRNKHNAAIGEVGENDKWQVCTLGIAVVSNRRDHADSQLAAIVKSIEQNHDTFVVEYNTEIL